MSMAGDVNKLYIDQYSYYDFKPAFRRRNLKNAEHQVPSWVGWHWRRLQAYTLIETYVRNQGRIWLTDMPEEDRHNRREYGDCATIVNQILASLIGSDQTIVVPEAEGEDGDDDAKAQLTLLNSWATSERWLQKLIQCERDSVKLGDGVYVLYWDDKLKRPCVRVYNPGFYFPVLDAENPDDDYPLRVHIAWEFEQSNDYNPNKKTRMVRRLTWELIETDAAVSYEWNDEPVNQTCLFWDGVWRLDNENGNLEDLNIQNATWNAQGVDLGIDFIPVVHIPAYVEEEEHFGRSCLAEVIQVVDDIVSTDSDLQAASATTGTPPIALSGVSAPTDKEGRVTSYGPGTVWQTGDGTATMIDTSSSLDALLKYDDALLKRLATNSKVPEALLGRVKPNEVPSGITLTLSFTPHSSMIREMRLVREDKYGLFFKFVSRLYMKNGELDLIFPANMKFGSFLPSDKQEASTIISTLRQTNPPSISIQTAIRILIDAGFPIEDAAEELNEIMAADFTGAQQLIEATGDPNLGLEHLGLPPRPEDLTEPPPAPPTPPVPTPPPAGA